MSRARVYLRGFVANGVGYGVNLVVMFFMSPFVVHTLGDVQYGVWSLMITLTGYLGLIELGMRSGVGRFINYYFGKNETDRVNEVVSTSILALLASGAALVFVAGWLAVLLPYLFPKIPAALVLPSRYVTLIISLNLVVGFLTAPFRHVLVAHERFDLTNGSDLFVVFVRTIGTVATLLAGYGLVALALVQLVSSIVGQACIFRLAKHVFPQLTVRRSLFKWERLRELFGYSIWAFVGAISWELLYTTDTVVIGSLLSPKWITYYAIAGLLLLRSRQLVMQAAWVFSPKILQDCARNEWPLLRLQFRQGSTVVMGLGILLLVGMVVFGKEFITLWMGPEFEVSYQVLVILSTATLMEVAFLLAGQFYIGLNRVRLSALLTISQGLVNLGLSVFFVIVLRQGIVGVAWGTFYPRIVFSTISGIIVLRWIRLPLRKFFWGLFVKWGVLGVAFWGVASWINSWALSMNWHFLVAKISAASVAYCILAWGLLLDQESRSWVRAAIVNSSQFAISRLST